jgi:hypothetical protein
MPETLPDNPALSSLKTAQECYLAGVHVEQYRDPAIAPDAYYREALSKDPEFAPALVALARFEYAHARYKAAYDLALKGYRALTCQLHTRKRRTRLCAGLAARRCSGGRKEPLTGTKKASGIQDAGSGP